MKKTKLVATVGPACEQPKILAQLIELGVDLLRINASHTTPAGLAQWIRHIRKTAAAAKRSVGILVDLQGPRVRTGKIAGSEYLSLIPGEKVMIAIGDQAGSGNVITTACREFPLMVKVGDNVLLDNGRMELEVLSVGKTRVRCRVVRGGKLGENKGINLPNAPVTLPALTGKDLADLRVAAKLDVDYIALSFVRSVEDMLAVKNWMKRHKKDIPVIAKIEKPGAIKQIEAIMEAADAVMVARGDLGIELGIEKVPPIQKHLIERARQVEKPIITATQMLETMIDESHPTRAEVSDIANAVFDGTDAVMLSGETAIGKFPLEAVRVMVSILRETERHVKPPVLQPPGESRRELKLSPIKSITRAGFEAAHHLGAKAIVVYTVSGRTARLVSKLQPACPIFVLTPSKKEITRMTLLRGVVPLLLPRSTNADEMIRRGDKLILRHGPLNAGDPVILISGKQALPAARLMTKIHFLGEN